MSRRERELERLAESEGLVVDRVEQGNSSHLKIYVRNAHGLKRIITTSLSPSDHRQAKNVRADFRRFARESSEQGGGRAA